MLQYAMGHLYKGMLTYLRDLEVAELKEEDMVYAYHYGIQFVK